MRNATLLLLILLLSSKNQLLLLLSSILGKQINLNGLGQSFGNIQQQKIFLFFCCYFSINLLLAQSTPIDSLELLGKDATITQKITQKNKIQRFLETIDAPQKRLSQTQQYYEVANTSQDSFFLAHSAGQLALINAITSDTFKYHIHSNKLTSINSSESIFLQENSNYLYNFIDKPEVLPFFEKYRELQSQYGISILELPKADIFDLYPALEIFKDQSSTTSFENIIANDNWFSINNTLVDFDQKATYWVKLTLRGDEQQKDTVSFFVEGQAGYTSWNHIHAYLVHEDGQIEQQQTGIALRPEEKPIRAFNNIISFSILPNEIATLYLRLNEATGERAPSYINLLGTRNKHLLKNGIYHTDGKFKYSNPFTPFNGNKLNVRNVFIDRSKQKTIEDISKDWNELEHHDGYNINFTLENSYWTKIQLVGNAAFNGEQFLHISPYSFVGADAFNFDYIDYYSANDRGGFLHQRTGFKVPLSERPLYFWANFLKVDVPLGDTLDLFVRLEGGNPHFIMNRLDFWHIDASSVFPKQMNEAIKNAIYFGILGIQGFFFLLLFGITRERIHFFFATLVLGIFLSQGFGEDNFRFFVPFPALRDYHIPFFFIGLFLVQAGFLKFTSVYFSIAKTAFINRFFIPIFLLCSAVVNIYAASQFSYSNFSEYPVDKCYYITAILFMFAGTMAAFLIGLFSRVKINAPKIFFIAAFLPGLLIGTFYLLRVVMGGLFGNVFITSFFPSFIFTYDALKFSIILMLFLFALSVGYRTNLLKADKEKALKQNLKDQKTIIEKLQQTDRLQELDQLKTRFFTNITHEFRTPLTVILGMAEQKENPKAIPLIRRNGQKLLQLINQLLDLSKLDTGHLQPFYQQIEIVSFTQYVGESFQSLADKKYIRLMIYSEIKQLWMDMDEEKYRQIISNLLSNAIKFTPESGKIILHLFQKEKQLLLKINDNGNGISENELPYIFDRFFQAENASSRQGKGTGIGLALVKELVELMKGTIEVESEIGKGTTFNLQFLIRQTASSRITEFEAVPIDSTIIDHSPSKLEENNSELPKLLIVEDNRDVIIYIQSLLSKQYDLQMAINGEQGIQKAIEMIPDIIISDVMMPKKDGFELVETLKQDERTSHIPIILLTAKATQEDKLTGLKYGADAYLTKPFDKEELLIRLEKLLALRQQLQEKYATTSIPQIIVQKEKTLDDIFLEKLHAVLEAHYENAELDVNQIAHFSQLNYTQFNRKLKALTNQTPAKYMRSFRLEKAKILLLDPNNDLNVSEVAYKVGFTDPNYFSRAFGEVFGKSPNSMRQ